jgi:uncharacterized protein (DUF983 family)
MPESSSRFSLAAAVRVLGRALRRRCPNCGGGGIWRNWLIMRETCPTCGIPFGRGEQGYIVGAYMLNIIAAELVFAAIFVAVLLSTWPDPPWEWLTFGSAVQMVVLPVLFYPYAKTIFLGMDLLIRPRGYDASDVPRPPTAGERGAKK